MNILPPIGAIVEYGGVTGKYPARYRVTGYLRRYKPQVKQFIHYETATSVGEVIDHILTSSEARFGPNKNEVLEWCTAENATHLSISGVGGGTAPIDKVKVVGRVNWTEEMIQNSVNEHNRRIGERVG